MIALEDALACYRDNVAPLATETVPIHAVLGRVLSAPQPAATDLPAFEQTAVDGYALRAADTAAATDANPVQLEVCGEVAAGTDGRNARLQPGQCLRIFTGAPMPDDCDAVIRQELVNREDTHISITQPATAGADIRNKAEELAQGQLLGRAGQRINSGLLAALSMAGVASIQACRQPYITLLVTGDEIVSPGQPLQPGEVYDANGPLVRDWLRERGYPEPALRYVRDDAAGTQAALAAALEQSDLVITTGGVSVGDRDYVPGVAEQLGAEPLFWKVAQKPGKPLYFARRGDALLLGLPGNPAAVLVGLAMHGTRILDCLQGLAEPGPLQLPGRLTASLNADGKRERLVRARRQTTADGVWLTPLTGQGSHMLSNLEAADALIRVPPGDQPLAEGDSASWTPL